MNYAEVAYDIMKILLFDNGVRDITRYLDDSSLVDPIIRATENFFTLHPELESEVDYIVEEVSSADDGKYHNYEGYDVLYKAVGLLFEAM